MIRAKWRAVQPSLTDVWHAFITGPDGVGMRDLGNLGEIKDYEDASAHGINGGGQTVGFTWTSLGERRAFITGPDGVGMRHLGPMDAYLFANDINDTGQVVGITGNFRGFITGPNGVGARDLGDLAGGGADSTSGEAINASGRVAGYSQRVNWPTLPCFYNRT